jgi:hypothetical protein
VPTTESGRRREQKAEAVQSERNRAVVAQCNAEIRRGKASLRLDFPKLLKLAKKKVESSPRPPAL